MVPLQYGLNPYACRTRPLIQPSSVSTCTAFSGRLEPTPSSIPGPMGGPPAALPVRAAPFMHRAIKVLGGLPRGAGGVQREPADPSVDSSLRLHRPQHINSLSERFVLRAVFCNQTGNSARSIASLEGAYIARRNFAAVRSSPESVWRWLADLIVPLSADYAPIPTALGSRRCASAARACAPSPASLTSAKT